jgi:hypothetical protein
MKPSALRLAAVLALASLAHAQQRPAPHLAFVYPAGGQQGTTLTISVGGQNLTGPAAAFVSGRGVTTKIVGYERPLTQKEINDLREKADELQAKRTAAKADSTKPPFTAEDEKLAGEIRQTLANRSNRQVPPALAETVMVEVTLGPDAALGERELRLKAASGLSNPIVFCVGQLPEVSEPVVTATSARPAPRGRAADLRAARTQSSFSEIILPATVNGQILPGEADRFRFTARKGQRLVFAVAARALMPYLADAVPGWFQATLALFDAQGHEIAYNDDFRFNPDPMLACEIPADGAYTLELKDAIYRGREDFVYRITAGELPFVTSIFPLGGPIAGRVDFALSGWNLPEDKLSVDTSVYAPGKFQISLKECELVSNPMRFALSALPECRAAGTNRSLDTAQALALPTIVNGRIAQAGDEAVFRFEGKAGDEIVAEVMARRLGSPLDSTLILTDAAGLVLASNDDCEDKASGLLTHHADSRLSCKLPANGAYFVRIGDAQGRGGSDYGYRLRLSAPQPGFELRAVPASINLRAGGTAAITVHVIRRDGFNGDITLALRDAPPGFTLRGARLPAGADKIQMTLTAPAAPREEPFDVKIIGTANIGERTISHAAVPAEDMMQAFAYHHLVTMQELKVCVTGRAPPARVAKSGTAK